ncbi:MAG TPA: MBL fold metallo-hydrolase [Actinomycetota bacterium]
MVPIVRVLAPNPGIYTLDGTNTWVVGAEPALVIDPGPEDPNHLQEVARTAGRVGAVVLTHDHDDHAEGATRFAELVGAPLFAWRAAGAERLTDGALFHAGDAEVVAVHTPGHSADHVAFHLPLERTLFTGDAVVGRGTTFLDPPDGDLSAYLTSLQRMLDLDAATILPGHGPLVSHARAKLLEYLEHRRMREGQVLRALADGPATVAELVGSIYAEHPVEVHELAARSVTAHLLKLLADERVTKHGRGRTQTWALAAAG